MTVTVAMYEKSWEHIGARLDALGLDISVVTLNRDGQFVIDGAEVPPSEMAIDYFWLSQHINRDGVRQTAFDAVLACKSVGVLQTFNAGLDDPFYKQAADRGIRLCNSSAQGVAIAEYVFAQVLSVLHPVAEQRAQQAEKIWKVTPFREISRQNWLILGFGPIGSAIAARVKAFGAGTMVVRRTPETSETVDRAGTPKDLHRFAAEADVIVLACPLNDATRGMADSDFFAALKQGAILVNIARGDLIDNRALLDALDRGQLETAILDVFHIEPLPESDPLWTHPKIRLTPHTSFAGDGVQDRWDQLFLENIVRFAGGEPLIREIDPVDF